MEEFKSKVYVYTDEKGRITRCEGGYTTENIKDFAGWTLIDEGNGDRYNLCQSHYFKGGLCTEDGIPRYKLVDGKPVLREDSEIQADIKEIPVIKSEFQILQETVDTIVLTMLNS